MLFSSAPLGALLLAAVAPVVLAQSPLYGQCGGSGWAGSKSCASGSCCTFSNDWYSQCLPCQGGGGNPTTTRATTRATTTAGTSPTSTPGGGGSPSGGTAGCGKPAALTSGTKSINIQGTQREYTLRLPDNYDPNKKYRVYFVYHPLGGSAKTTVDAKYNGLLPLGNNAKDVIFVAPGGISNGWANSGGRDIALTDAINSLLDSGLCVDPTRRFAQGFSYGAGMSFSVACERAKVFRAVSVVAGALLSGCSGGNDPIAYLGIHGTADGTCTIAGGKQLRDRFVKNNGCQNTNAPQPSNGSGTNRIKTEFQGCRAGYPVTWIAHGGAHTDGMTDEKGQKYVPLETQAFFGQF